MLREVWPEGRDLLTEFFFSREIADERHFVEWADDPGVPIPYSLEVVSDPPGMEDCNGYDHPTWAVRQSRDREWSCVSCGVVLV